MSQAPSPTSNTFSAPIPVIGMARCLVCVNVHLRWCPRPRSNPLWKFLLATFTHICIRRLVHNFRRAISKTIRNIVWISRYMQNIWSYRALFLGRGGSNAPISTYLPGPAKGPEGLRQVLITNVPLFSWSLIFCWTLRTSARISVSSFAPFGKM